MTPDTFQTEHSNQLHQLLVSVSRHFYLTRDGLLTYQQKPMEINITNYHKSKKGHLVYYIMRDHFSGNFVFQLATTRSLIPLADFLYLAWGQEGGENHFRGLPGSLSVPATLSSPKLLDGLAKLGIIAFQPSSGFASGIRILRTLEENICFNLGRIAEQSLGGLAARKERIYKFMLDYPEDKVKKWQEGLPPGHPREIQAYDLFIKNFAAQVSPEGGLPLVGEPGGAAKPKAKPISVLSEPITNHKFSPEKLEEAQDLIYEAWEMNDRSKCLRTAYEALRISPYCADAYNLLAAESESREEKLRLYQKGVEAGRLALGEDFFKEHTGEFWGWLETRPYMRALEGLGQCLWKDGQKSEAVGIYQEMLRLNPNDNQGVRYLLSSWLLEENRDQECRELLEECGEEILCYLHYNKALLAFRRGGGNSQSNRYLREAIKANPYVPPYLLGQKPLPFQLPDYYGFGDEDEAVIYASEAKKAWEQTSGALEWLKKLAQRGT